MQERLFSTSRQTLELREYLSTITDHKHIVTYLQLSEIAGCDVQKDKRGWLQTAIRIDEREGNGRLWGCVRGVGVKLMSPDEAVEIGSNGIRRAASLSRKALRRISKCDYRSMSEESQLKHNINAAVLGALSLCSRPSSQDKIKQQVLKVGKLEVEDTIRLFSTSRPQES